MPVDVGRAAAREAAMPAACSSSRLGDSDECSPPGKEEEEGRRCRARSSGEEGASRGWRHWRRRFPSGELSSCRVFFFLLLWFGIEGKIEIGYFGGVLDIYWVLICVEIARKLRSGQVNLLQFKGITVWIVSFILLRWYVPWTTCIVWGLFSGTDCVVNSQRRNRIWGDVSLLDILCH